MARRQEDDEYTAKVSTHDLSEYRMRLMAKTEEVLKMNISLRTVRRMRETPWPNLKLNIEKDQ